MKAGIGIYRTVYPLCSETFIRGQIEKLSDYRAVLICRDLLEKSSDLEVVTLPKRYHLIEKIIFTLTGDTTRFSNQQLFSGIKLVHAHFAQDACLMLPTIKRLGIPLIVSCHGSDVLTNRLHLLANGRLTDLRYIFQRSRLIRETSVFVAVSQFLRRQMIRQGFPENKILVHYVGVDTKRFAPNAAARNYEHGSYLLSIARHVDVKGIDVLLRAVARVKKHFPDVMLVQIGDGPLSGALRKLCIELNIQNNVRFLGGLEQEKVIPYVQACSGLVLSSRRSSSGAEESLGLVLAEASACEKPVIGTRVGGIPEVIRDRETGFLVESENVEELSQKIETLLCEPDLAEKMGRAGRQYVVRSFDLEKQTARLEATYSDLLESSSV